MPNARKPASKTAAKKPVALKKAMTTTMKTKPAPASPKKRGPRQDLGAPSEGWFAQQPQPQRAILEALWGLILEAAPEAVGSLKWGMPFFTVGGVMMCALTTHKAHVNLVLSGPAVNLWDPQGRLTGDGKTGRHLRLNTLDELPREAVRGWLRAAAKHSRSAGTYPG